MIRIPVTIGKVDDYRVVFDHAVMAVSLNDSKRCSFFLG